MTSPKTANRLSRILSMIPWVLAHPGATVDEVCERFGYEPDELAKDLDLIFVCGLPGYGPGDLMEAYIDEDEVIVDMADYFAAAPPLAPAEALTLLASGMALLSSGHASDALASGVAKLQQALLDGEDEVLAVDMAAEPGYVETLRTAAGAGRVVDISYLGMASGELTERAIEPHVVFSTMGNWYVTGHCRLARAERTFRVDRIRHLETTEERFERPEATPEPVVRYQPDEDAVHAVIELGPRARWVVDYYPVDVLEDDGEALIVKFAASQPEVAARLLVRLGSSARLVEGTEVAAATESLRTRVLSRYSG